MRTNNQIDKTVHLYLSNMKTNLSAAFPLLFRSILQLIKKAAVNFPALFVCDN